MILLMLSQFLRLFSVLSIAFSSIVPLKGFVLKAKLYKLFHRFLGFCDFLEF